MATFQARLTFGSSCFSRGASKWCASANILHDTFISDFDRGLCHASSGLAQEKLVSSVKVQLSDSARIALASTEKRHHKVTKELLAKKGGISISRAEATLKASTQLSLQSAIMPLS